MTNLGIHLLLFAAGGAVFLLVPLVIGLLVRPRLPTPEKEAVYECGEPTIGTSYIQFDLRFYVVALLFVIFDVELAFFFPWAMVFGGATQLADPTLSESTRMVASDKLLDVPRGTSSPATALSVEDASTLALTGLADILVFFGVLLVGFAYVWKRGDLDWVRAMIDQARRSAAHPRTPPVVEQTFVVEQTRETHPVG